MLSIALDVDFFDSRKTNSAATCHEGAEAHRCSALFQYERRASSLKQWSRVREKTNSASVGYEVSRPGCAVAQVLVTFFDDGCGAPPSIRIAGSFEGRAGQDVEELAEQLRFVLGLDYDWIACDAALQSLCATLFMDAARSVSVSVKRADK